MLTGTRGTINVVHGKGLLTITSDTGMQINFQTAIDPAIVQTQAGNQAGTTLLCISSGGSGKHYTCALNPVARGYTTGMVLYWLSE